MRVVLHGEAELALEDVEAPGLDVRDAAGAVATPTPVQLLALALGACTAAVLASYAKGPRIDTAGLALRVRWEERERRVARYDVEVRWPALPPSRLEAARRAAHLCTVHRTLAEAPELALDLRP